MQQTSAPSHSHCRWRANAGRPDRSLLLMAPDRVCHRCPTRVFGGGLIGNTHHQPITRIPAVIVWSNRIKCKIRAVPRRFSINGRRLSAAVPRLVIDCVIPRVWIRGRRPDITCEEYLRYVPLSAAHRSEQQGPRAAGAKGQIRAPQAVSWPELILRPLTRRWR